MLKNMEVILDKEIYIREITDLMNRHRNLVGEFNIKKMDMENFKNNYAANIAAQKTYIKPEPVSKKAKTISTQPKISVFAGTPLDVSSKNNASDVVPDSGGANSTSFSTHDVHATYVGNNMESGYSSSSTD